MNKHIVLMLAVAVMLALPLGGCAMTTPSQIRTGAIQLEEDVNAQGYEWDLMTGAQSQSLAREYRRVGRGPLSATVSYEAGSGESQRQAQTNMARILADLRRHGVKQADVHYVAAADRQQARQVIFTYPALRARAPDHCTRLPGYQGAESLAEVQNYQISCETKEVLSRMIARPEDLLGRDGRENSTARRSSAVVESYQDGEPNEAFYDIAAASEVGQ